MQKKKEQKKTNKQTSKQANKQIKKKILIPKQRSGLVPTVYIRILLMNMCLCLTSHYQAMTGFVSQPIMNPQNMFDLLYLTLCYCFKISMFYSFGQLLYFHGIKNKMDNEVQVPQICNMSKLNFICKIVIGILLNVNGNYLNVTVCKISLLVVSRLQTAVNRVLFFFAYFKGIMVVMVATVHLY